MANLVPDLTSKIRQSLDAPLNTGTSKNEYVSPWEADPAQGESIFWSPIKIDSARWNKLYPYRLIVIDVSKPGKPPIVGGKNGPLSLLNLSLSTTTREQGLEYIITQTARPNLWEVILPITPQQLKITDQFAINTSATMRGVIEEHNGVKFKTITASGTTGIWPKKPTIAGNIQTPSSINSIFGGTLEAFAGVAQGVSKIANSFSGDHPNKKSSSTLPENTEAKEFSTGYYQALLLGQFFERYAEAKKNPANKGWRLVFDIPKQNQSFIVTPLAFELNQSERKPNEMMFSFQLKAWKRIDLEEAVEPAGGELPNLSANTFQRIVGIFAQTRRTLSGAVNLVKAVRSDFQKPFNALRQASLAVKDLAGLAFAVGDLPRQIIDDMDSTIRDASVNFKSEFPVLNNLSVDTRTWVFGSKVETSSGNAGDAIQHTIIMQKNNEGLSNEEVASGALGEDAAARLETDPLNEIFENPEGNFALLNAITVDDLNITTKQQQAIDDELLRIRLININDLRGFRQELVSLAHDIADNFGAGDTTYSNVYGLPTPKTRAIAMTDEENEILQSIFESVQAFDLLTATKQFDDFSIQNPLEFVGGLANESGINFEDFSSKLLAPVPFGSTIEEIAARYMGDSSKWLEIVTLNSLRSPYIDEVGFTYEMLSNAEGRQFNVDDTDNNLFVGQKITIVSDTQPPITRKIINVEKIGDGNFLITLDGLADLDIFQTTDNARMQGYLPGTVNSQNQIYIPVNAPSDPDDRTFDIANIPSTTLNKLAKADFLLTDNFDIAINSVGDFRLASGLTNLIQALKLKIRTQKGTILKHLDYGVGLTHGVSVADIENGAIIKSLNAMIASDSRFQSIDSISIRLIGSTMAIDMSITIANGSGILPISFDIRAS